MNPTRSYSAKDLPAETHIKYREPLKPSDFKQEIAKKEQTLLGKRSEAPTSLPELKLEVENPFTQDADLNFDSSEKSSSENEESDEDDLELLREYEKLKKERLEE